MKSPIRFVSIAAALGLAISLASGAASALTPSDHHVTQAQLNALSAGESSHDIIASLGQPENTPKWLDGSQSLVYETYDAAVGPEHVYVDVDSAGKMIDVYVSSDD